MTTLMSLNGVTKQFGTRNKRVVAVDNVDLAVETGETLGIVGESGCGKSTLARLALRLIEPSDGRIEFDGRDITPLDQHQLRGLRSEIQIVFQDPNASLNPRWTVGRIVGEPLVAQRRSSADVRERVAQMLALVGLPADAVNRHPASFSGGQRQRIGIARALAPAPRLLVCDEAVSALDASVQAQILNLLKDLQTELNLTLLFISHNLAVIRHLSQRVAVMYLGRIVEIADEAAFFGEPLHPYSVMLIAAVPEPGLRPRYLGVSAEPADGARRPPGCHFHPRCPIARARCSTDDPDLLPASNGHLVRCHYPGELVL